MILLILYLFLYVVLLLLGSSAQALLEPIMAIVITLAGITILFASVGVKVFNNLGTTIVSEALKAFGYIIRTAINAIGWIFVHIFRIAPRIYTGSRNFFTVSVGLNTFVSSLLAIIVTIIVIVVII